MHKIPVIRVELEGIKDKVLIDTGESASFVAAEWYVLYIVRIKKDSQGYDMTANGWEALER